jgi:hypothetical protein
MLLHDYILQPPCTSLDLICIIVDDTRSKGVADEWTFEINHFEHQSRVMET